jgi:RNA polymerase sigma-70 factor (ECF subfamily)
MCQVKQDSADTARLLKKAQGGDRSAFEQLFQRYRPDLCRMVELRLDERLCSRIDASDVVQEAQFEAFRRLADFFRRQPMPFWLWLRKTAYERLLNLRRDHLRAGRREVDREVPLPERSSLLLAQQFSTGGSTPSQRLVRREYEQRVRQAVAELPDADREILLMRNVEGLTHQEVGCLLGITDGAARKRYGRALLRLRKLLAANGLTESQL